MAKKGIVARRKARQEYERARKTSRLGEGKRFAAIEEAARLSGAENPAAVAAAAGRKAHGKEKMAKWAAAGRRRAAKRKG